MPSLRFAIPAKTKRYVLGQLVSVRPRNDTDGSISELHVGEQHGNFKVGLLSRGAKNHVRDNVRSRRQQVGYLAVAR